MSPLRLFYGGTFDPIHHGHLAIARAAHSALGEPVRFLPAADPPHRATPGATAADRVAMLALALAGEPGFVLDQRELGREGPSYSIDTLHALRAEFGADAPLALLVGADSFLALPSWHSWRELFGLAHFVVAARHGSPLTGVFPAELAEAVAGRWADEADALRATPAGRVLALRQPLYAHSATDVRERMVDGRQWRHLLPPPVADYIVAHGLYGLSGSGGVIGA